MRRPFDAYFTPASAVEQGELFDAPKTEPCRYDCGGKALLGPERYNATRTCMNQSATCQRCKKVAEVSRNLMITKLSREIINGADRALKRTPAPNQSPACKGGAAHG